MRNSTFLAIVSLTCFLFTDSMGAQEKQPEQGSISPNAEKYTLMEQFEPELVLSVAERVRLKKERKAVIKRRRGILNTLDISEKRRQRLIKALLKNPFSNKLNRAVAEIEFVEDEIEN
ncbi:MAG: hypothetical protein HKP49_00590 [Maribacter sp.]|nr:hypothetical protein [Maribacter sp.]